MTIYSWNIWFRNKDVERVYEFIRARDADVLCLQEVPEALLNRLQQLPYHLCYGPESDRLVDGTLLTTYMVTLSKYPIKRHALVPLPYWEPTIPFRTRLFVACMVRLGLWSWGKGNRHGLSADIETSSGLVRVLNFHFVLMSPAARAEEMRLAMAHIDSSLPSILCGDFNIIDSPRMSPLNWILGGTISDALFWRRERKNSQSYISEYGLVNPHKGTSTHPVSGSQLDHILVSNHFHIERAEVLKHRVGSDHHPIFVQIKRD